MVGQGGAEEDFVKRHFNSGNGNRNLKSHISLVILSKHQLECFHERTYGYEGEKIHAIKNHQLLIHLRK